MQKELYLVQIGNLQKEVEAINYEEAFIIALRALKFPEIGTLVRCVKLTKNKI